MFKSGKSGNPYGRPAGAVNLATKEIREAITVIVNNNLLQLQTDIESLQPGERVRCLLALMDFVLPKLQKVQVQSADEQTDDGAHAASGVTITFVDALT